MTSAGEAITVSVRLSRMLAEYRPDPDQDVFPIDLAVGSTVGDLLDRLDMPLDKAKLIFVDHAKWQVGDPLADGVTVEIFPAIAGG